ncbi:MAG: amino acid permease, partial [Bartonella sp.]|nr:amino acid permease [Bartonella sp.]
SNGRILYSLAMQKNAPHIFSKLNATCVPYVAILFSSICTATIIVINVLMPNNSFMRIMAITTVTAAITWAIIVIVHFKFRKAHKGQEKSFVYAFSFYPYANYL